MQNTQIYRELVAWGGENLWIIQAFLVVFVTLLCNLLLRHALKKIHQRLLATPNPWDDAVISAIQGPATLMVWVIGLTFAAEVGYTQTQATLFNVAETIRQVGVVGAISWFLIRLTRQLQQTIVTRNRQAGKEVEVATVDAVGKLLRASILITATLVVLQTLGFSISGILAFGGIGGIAIGFAAKDLLANFLGGLMLYLDRPFAVGDWVRSPDRDIEGVVEDIGWRLTRIRSFDMRPIYIPNGIFSTMVIVNPSRMTHRQLYETIGIRYRDADKMTDIVTAVKTMLAEHPDLDHAQITIVNFDRFAPSSLDFFVYAYTRTTKWVQFHQIKQNVLLNIHQIIRAHGAEVAFPTSTVHVADAVQIEQSEAKAQSPDHP